MEGNSNAARRRRRSRSPWTQINSPQTQINYWMDLAVTRFAVKVKPRMRACNLIASEWATLRALYRPNRLSPMDIANAIGMSKGGASKLVDRLVKKGLVRKEIGEYDGRTRTVELTREGKKLVPRMALFDDAADRRFYRLLRPTGRRGLLRALKRALGVEHKAYMDQWISNDGRSGQWALQFDWLRSIRVNLLRGSALRYRQQSIQFFRR
jgi:DNA-binding MarR family transcriptional regulator